MSQAIEEPTYDLVRQIGDQIELRRYAAYAYAVAEVMLDTTTAADAGNPALPILAATALRPAVGHGAVV